MDRTATWILAGLGAICIYAGYRLFFAAPAAKRQGFLPRRAALLLMNMLPGAVLTLFGAAILTTAASTLFWHRQPVIQHTPAAGTSLRLRHLRTEFRA